jgi:pyochelin synthetase
LVFSQLLGNTQFSKYDSYFALGGDSLTAIRLVNKLNQKFNSNITISTIFEEDTVHKLAQLLKGNERSDSSLLIAIKEGEI